jgi:hypothetical protein
MEEKTIQVTFHDNGTATIQYFLGDEEVGEPKHFEQVPKRLEFFLEKFPRSKGKSETK